MGCKVYVGNLNYQTREESLRELFENYGAVVSIHLAKDRETGRFRGFAFVEMSDPAEVAEAVKDLDGKEFDNRQLRVKEAEERPRPPRRDDY